MPRDQRQRGAIHDSFVHAGRPPRTRGWPWMTTWFVISLLLQAAALLFDGLYTLIPRILSAAAVAVVFWPKRREHPGEQ